MRGEENRGTLQFCPSGQDYAGEAAGAELNPSFRLGGRQWQGMAFREVAGGGKMRSGEH